MASHQRLTWGSEVDAANRGRLRASADRMRLCEILRRAIPFHRAGGDRVAERAAIDEFKAAAQAMCDPRWLGEAFKAEAEHFNVYVNEDAAAVAIRRAAEQFDAAGSLAQLGLALGLQASIAAGLGDTADADACIGRARKIASASPDTNGPPST